MPTLTIQLPGLPPVDHILRDEMMTIGRMKGNTIALDDSSVSVSHAKISHKNGEFFLKDLNSTNGTMLNGQTINEARLRDGDQIKFGEVLAHYHAEPAFVSATHAPSTVAAQTSAVTSQSTPQSPPAARASEPQTAPVQSASFPTPSTSFISKRLVSQAAPAPKTSVSSASRSSPSSKQKRSWLAPILGTTAALAAAGVLGWMFFGGDAGGPPRTSNPTAAQGSGKKPLPDRPAPVPPSKQISPSGVKTTIADSNENQSLPELKKALKAADPSERRRAAAALHSLGSGAKDAVPDLRTALNDPDPDVKMWSALALINNKSYDKATIPILVQVLRNENATLRQVACLSLALIPYDEAERQTVIGALNETKDKDSDREVRDTAKSALKIIAPDLAEGGK